MTAQAYNKSWQEVATEAQREREELRAQVGVLLNEIESWKTLHANNEACIADLQLRVRATAEPPAEQLPSAWIKGHTLHTDAGIEYDEEVVPGSDRPKGDGWHPLYSRPSQPPPVGPLKLDTAQQVFFYEQDHYYLSNFSAFRLNWQGWGFDTSEAAYHWEKFPNAPEVRESIRFATSAHEAFKVAERYKALRRPDWDLVKVGIMKAIICQKALQHEYVSRKLLETGDRELIENSWRDDYWGWGPNRNGQNMLGKLWMEVRAELRASTLTKPDEQS